MRRRSVRRRRRCIGVAFWAALVRHDGEIELAARPGKIGVIEIPEPFGGVVEHLPAQRVVELGDAAVFDDQIVVVLLPEDVKDRQRLEGAEAVAEGELVERIGLVAPR